MRKLILVVIFLVLCPLLAAQQALNNEAIIKLVKAGLSEDLIVTTINAAAGSYDISADGIIALKTAGASDKVVAAVVAKASAPAPAAPVPPPPAAAPAPPPAAPAAPSLPPGIDSIGLYYPGKDGSWQEVIAYGVNVASGPAIKSFTKHMFKGNDGGQVDGESSRLKLTLPIKLLLYLPEGRSPGEYLLVRFRIVKGNREFSLTPKVPETSSGTTASLGAGSGSAAPAPIRDTVDFDTKKVAPHLYEIDLGKDLGKGEYGLLPPSDPASTGKNASQSSIYTFSFTE
jgi:hypothetical protein